jgi:MFS transporter, YNFM family, putative membrane transport protein
LTHFGHRRPLSFVSGMSSASRPTAGHEGLRGPRRPGELLYALQEGHQGATVVVLAMAGLAVLGLLAVWIPLSPALEGTYGVTAADSATSGVFFAAAFSIGGLAGGPIADGYGRRPVLLVGLALLAAATVVVAASPTWPLYLAARVGQGAAAGTFAPVAVTWVSEALPTSRRTLGLGVLITAYQASAITGQLYGQVVGEALGWRWVYVLLAAFYVLVTVILVRRLYEPGQQVPGETGGLALVRNILKLLGTPVLLAAWLLGALLLAAIFGVYGGMQVHLPVGVGQDGDLLVWIRAVGLLGILAVPVVLWKLGGRDPMALIVAGVVVCAVGLLAQTLTQGMVALGVGSVAVAGGCTLAITLLTVLIGQFAPAARATALAIQSFTLDLGTSGAAWLSVRLSWPELCSLIAAAVAAGALLVAVAVRTQRLAGWVPEGQQ